MGEGHVCTHCGLSCARAVVKSVTDGPFSEPSSQKFRNTAGLCGRAVKSGPPRRIVFLFSDVLTREESRGGFLGRPFCRMKGARNASGNAAPGPDATIGLPSSQITAFLVSSPPFYNLLRRRRWGGKVDVRNGGTVGEKSVTAPPDFETSGQV